MYIYKVISRDIFYWTPYLWVDVWYRVFVRTHIETAGCYEDKFENAESLSIASQNRLGHTRQKLPRERLVRMWAFIWMTKSTSLLMSNRRPWNYVSGWDVALAVQKPIFFWCQFPKFLHKRMPLFNPAKVLEFYLGQLW